MLKLIRTIGLEKLEHFRHKSLWSVREILQTIGRVIKRKIIKASKKQGAVALRWMMRPIFRLNRTLCLFICPKHESRNPLLGWNVLMESQDTITKCTNNHRLHKRRTSHKWPGRLEPLSLASDGASVMVGKNRGMPALLKKGNPRMINVHCICHQLALACWDTNKQVQCMLTVECLLVDILKLLHHDSCLSEDATWTLLHAAPCWGVKGTLSARLQRQNWRGIQVLTVFLVL